MLFGEEVAAVDGAAGDAGRQRAPDPERASLIDVPGGERSGRAPQREHRAGDPAAGGTVGTVMVTVDAGCRPILPADRVEVLGVLQLSEVLRPRAGVEGGRRRAPR